MSGFADLFSANKEFVKNFKAQDLTGQARKGLAIVTCMDSRIDPLRIVGMAPGDAKILRNAGARVTEDVLRTLVLATHLLNVSRILVMPHTDCKMASGSEEEIHATITYAEDLFSAERIQRLTCQLLALLASVLQAPDSPLPEKPKPVTRKKTAPTSQRP
jgi:carbonic anhydrase